MENPMTETVPARDARAYLGHDTDARAELRELSVLQVPVGTNLADVERQNREDAEYRARPRSFYHGVEGRWNPEDGWIYEP